MKDVENNPTALSVCDVAHGVFCLLASANQDVTFKEMPLEGKLVVLKAAAAVVEQMVGLKAAMEAVQKSLDKMD